MDDRQDVLTGPGTDPGTEPGTAPDREYERFSRARLYTVATVVAALLTCWYMVHNLFLAPVVGIVGAVCGWRGIKNGGDRRLLLIMMGVCLLPALVAIIALLLLLPGLPSLSFSHVKIVKG